MSNVLAIFLMPLNLAFWGSRRPETDALLQSVNLNALEMVAQIALIIGVPFVLGIWAARRFPEIAAKAQPWVKNGSLVALLIFIVAGVSGNASYFVDYIGMTPAEALRAAIRGWLSRRFDLDVPLGQIAACVGTKEFVATTPHYLRLREISPAPHAACLKLNGTTIMSASPELFLKMDGRTITTRPIKGTRPRFITDVQRDVAAQNELRASEKEKAELLIFVTPRILKPAPRVN